MNEQINLRLPVALLKEARQKAKAKGFGTVQAYIEQTVRDDVYERLTPKETVFLSRLIKKTESEGLWADETEVREALRPKNLRKSSRSR